MGEKKKKKGVMTKMGAEYKRNPKWTEEEWQTRVDLAAAYRLLDLLDMNEGVCNHLSAIVPGEKDKFLVIEYGMAWDEVTASNLLLVDAEGKVYEEEEKENEREGGVEENGMKQQKKKRRKKRAPDSTAFWIHSRIHVSRPQTAMCILHTHMPWSTALCCLKDGKLEMIHQNCLRFYKNISYDEIFNGLVIETKEADRLCAAMGDKKVLFHNNHGIIVAGSTIHEAFDDIYYLERAAEVVVKALSCGRELSYISEEVCLEFQKQMEAEGNERWARLHFDALKRKLKRMEEHKDFDT